MTGPTTALERPLGQGTTMNRSTQRGSTLIGFVAGVVLGLLVAVGVALYITNAPVPFMEKVKRPTENINPAADGKLPDPNQPLYSPPPGPPPATALEAIKGSAPDVGPAKSATAEESTRFMLQAGAFRATEDADAMRAQLAMLGLDAKIYPVEASGVTFYRVRLGPYGQRADLERIQKQLTDSGVQTQVIPLK